MKSLKTEGAEFLELTEALESISRRRGSAAPNGPDISEILDNYNAATSSLSFRQQSKLKNAVEYLHSETLRLSMTGENHPHYQQLSSNQASAKELFAREIAALIERN